MLFYFDATEDFLKRQNEISILLETAKEKDGENQELFLKLAVVSLVTKFQVYIESLLKEFEYILRHSNITYKCLPLYMRLNSIKMDIEKSALNNLLKHNKFNEDTQQKIVKYICSINHIVDEGKLVNDDLKIKTAFPLGRTGKDELLDLFKQVEGKDNIFIDENGNEAIDLNQLDSLLLTRHLIIHQDRFNQTENKVEEYNIYIKRVVLYCDNYLSKNLEKYGVKIEYREMLHHQW